MVGRPFVADCDEGPPDASPVITLILTLGPVEKGPKLFLQANVAHRRQRVFPVPVGLSSSALLFCSILHAQTSHKLYQLFEEGKAPPSAESRKGRP